MLVSVIEGDAMSPDFIPSQPEGVYLYPFLRAGAALGAPPRGAGGLGRSHTPRGFPLPGVRYSKYREPEKVSCKPHSFGKEN